MNLKAVAPFLLLSLLLVSSCTINDEEYSARQTEITEHADIVLHNASCTLSQSDDSPVTLTAEKLSFWTNSNRIEAENLSFVQSDSSGEIKAQGTCRGAVIDTSSEVMDLSGDVELSSPQNDLSISASGLIFDTKAQTVRTDNDVRITFEDGIIEATGLDADLNRMSMSLGNIISGEIQV